MSDATPRLDLAFMQQALPEARLIAGQNGEQNPAISGASQDSRQIQSGMLYVALPGERVDGHDYIAAAADNGAACALISQQPAAPLPIPALLVEDVVTALADAAQAWRRAVNPSVVAVTGSSGKTTVKEMLAAVLRKDRPTHATAGNYNNHIGLPLTLLNMPAKTHALALEMGMSGPGEIAELARIAEPDIGIVTNILPAHLAGFDQNGTVDPETALDAIAAAKGELIAGLKPGGLAVLPADDPRFAALRAQVPEGCRVESFGKQKGEAGFYYAGLEGTGQGMRLSLSSRHSRAAMPVRLQAVGEHMASNAAASALATIMMGVSEGTIRQGLESFQTGAGRGRVTQAKNGARIIDETYNANPGSMAAALANLSWLGRPHHRVAILGDMLELGAASDKLHREIIKQIGDAGIDRVFLTGTEMAALWDLLQHAEGVRAEYEPDPADWLGRIGPRLRPDDAVLIKGSRGMKLERLVEDLTGK
ncbi:UDP-N-acetylmuramoyl-tripeptide--D-alanyl-D-alanine ligase [Magnetofaba australis]|uniref:UDP-N-acetylmuramoyl-tripeptide--D-alanyl-D-alanine ligase n=1 Tax=Magnetofaba australis IT-1 TaxID=1434232 RepID=A0A1Y2KAV7_9PROT|nr:UDP-N-acetylmuramoyl-tripeptide--D-alanyl-D-alanine ligase [Magnetofaba australis]OSM07064.1 putative UDP-N-acetylmuramoyl-tripeptide--D-alanyl-D-alanine ligase [Magnetofaba australis IT-1]